LVFKGLTTNQSGARVQRAKVGIYLFRLPELHNKQAVHIVN